MTSYSLLPEDWWKIGKNFMESTGKNFMESTRNRVNRFTNTSHEDALTAQTEAQQRDLYGQTDEQILRDTGAYSSHPLDTPNEGAGALVEWDTDKRIEDPMTLVEGSENVKGGIDKKAVTALLSILEKKVNEEEPVKLTAAPTVGQEPHKIASEILGQGTKYGEMMNAFINAVR